MSQYPTRRAVRSPLRWTVLALLTSTAAMGGARAASPSPAEAAVTQAPRLQQAAWPGGQAAGWGVRGRALAAVKATPDQQQRISTIMQAAAVDLKAQRAQGQALRQQMAQLLAAPTLDGNAVEQLRQRQLALQDSVSKRRVQAQLDAAAVLSPDQRAQLGSWIAQRQDLMQRQRREREALNGTARS